MNKENLAIVIDDYDFTRNLVLELNDGITIERIRDEVDKYYYSNYEEKDIITKKEYYDGFVKWLLDNKLIKDYINLNELKLVMA